jgi:hypothetical protein
VRLAELEIDPAQIENYKAALKEEIETSIRVESGVDVICRLGKESSRSNQAFGDL